MRFHHIVQKIDVWSLFLQRNFDCWMLSGIEYAMYFHIGQNWMGLVGAERWCSCIHGEFHYGNAGNSLVVMCFEFMATKITVSDHLIFTSGIHQILEDVWTPYPCWHFVLCLLMIKDLIMPEGSVSHFHHHLLPHLQWICRPMACGELQ